MGKLQRNNILMKHLAVVIVMARGSIGVSTQLMMRELSLTEEEVAVLEMVRQLSPVLPTPLKRKREHTRTQSHRRSY